ncbi:DNA-binding protein [Prosthecomicrobium hirschii]|uniref:XRE family transcriptional regulator n=1 Tax=Prosthecodimorpha hirschii TaxID=665126 RepID=UPI00112BECFE|nr:XRE family transcriptional regulator [Prosthecomicrobium hirschii]TPQ47666.1 DNA-binding protein [Prosthecomicrobium hirschii]
MRMGTPGFIPQRLTDARAARRIASRTALARLISVNSSTVARWEDGSNSPDADALSLLSETLRVRREFFLRPIQESPRARFYRTLSSTLKGDIGYQQAQMKWLQEISAIVQHYVDFPAIDIPDVLEGCSYKQLRDEDIEAIALRLRRHWSLGEGPCPDLLAFMERIGIVVAAIEMNTSKLDGLCSWDAEDRPYVLLATDKMSFPRRQMDAAHELAHAVLHRNVTATELKCDLKLIESQAFRLASAFLMPSTSYPHEVVRPSLAMFQTLKERWRVSIKAQIKRLSDLEQVDPDHQTDLYKLYSAKGWNSKGEPLDRAWPLTEPRMLRQSLEMIIASQVRTKDDLLAVEFTMSPGDVENLAALPPGWFTSRPGEIIQLRQDIKRTSNSTQHQAVVVKFPGRSK